MSISRRLSILSALATALALPSIAQSHQIWLEQAAGQNAMIRFGEFGENLRETSPGLLDRFGKPAATLISPKGTTELAVTKAANGFSVPARPAKGASLIAEDPAFPLRKFKQGDKEVTSWYRPAARLITGFAAQEPKLTLDLVPLGQPGQFKLSFKGQPLAKTKVTLVTQSGWAKEERTDEQGVVKFDMPWKGQYVAEVSHIDRTPGDRAGEQYDGVNYVTTLTYVKPLGVAPIPAGPVRKPRQ